MDYAKIDDIVEIKPNIQIPCKQETSIGNYRLYGIVHHYGTKGNGHYIADVMDENNWYTCDDERVMRLDGEPDYNSSSAYVLFYTKVDQAVSR